MPIQPQLRDGTWYMTGLTPGGAEEVMGTRCFDLGNGHYVGFDDSFEDSLVVRAYYDPEVAPDDFREKAAMSYVGYAQFVEIAFLGQAIPPSVYGSVFADRVPYATQGDPFTFLDFMGPAQAQMLAPGTGLDPFFAYNGALVNGALRSIPGDFAVHPLPNGSLRLGTVTAENGALAASIVTEVPASRVTSSEVGPFLTDDNLERAIDCTAADLANYEAYQIALHVLTQLGEPLEGITYEEMGARAVGPYVLLSLPDPENTAPTLCISSAVSGSEGRVYVHLLDYDDLDGMEENADAGLLYTLRDYLSENGRLDVVAMDEEPMDVAGGGTRGRGGLMANPFVIAPGSYCLELRYHTLAFGRVARPTRASGTVQPLSGFSWSTLFQWDEDTRTLVPAAVREPLPLAAYDFLSPLARYAAALRDPSLSDAVIDTTNFTRAAMHRDRFGGTAAKVVYLDRGGDAL